MNAITIPMLIHVASILLIMFVFFRIARRARRDYFAAKAMQSLCMHEEYQPTRAAKTAYEYADAMLKARVQ